jgi:hypothetical protein
LRLLDLIKSSSICTYIRYPYTSDILVEFLVFFEDVGEVSVSVELDADKHSGVVEYVKEKCEEYVEEDL